MTDKQFDKLIVQLCSALRLSYEPKRLGRKRAYKQYVNRTTRILRVLTHACRRYRYNSRIFEALDLPAHERSLLEAQAIEAWTSLCYNRPFGEVSAGMEHNMVRGLISVIRRDEEYEKNRR